MDAKTLLATLPEIFVVVSDADGLAIHDVALTLEGERICSLGSAFRAAIRRDLYVPVQDERPDQHDPDAGVVALYYVKNF